MERICRTLILRGREQESKYGVEIVSMKSEMMTLAGEITILRARVFSGSSDDDALRDKCTQLARYNEIVVSRMWDTERQLVLARRGEAELETSLRNTSRDNAQHIFQVGAYCAMMTSSQT